MSEKERNKRFIKLLYLLRAMEDAEALELLESMAKNDTPAMQKSFEVVTGGKLDWLMHILVKK